MNRVQTARSLLDRGLRLCLYVAIPTIGVYLCTRGPILALVAAGVCVVLVMLGDLLVSRYQSRSTREFLARAMAEHACVQSLSPAEAKREFVSLYRRRVGAFEANVQRRRASGRLGTLPSDLQELFDEVGGWQCGECTLSPDAVHVLHAADDSVELYEDRNGYNTTVLRHHGGVDNILKSNGNIIQQWKSLWHWLVQQERIMLAEGDKEFAA